VVTLFVPAAQAQDIGYRGAGFRIGLNTYPNQFQFGGQLNLGEFIDNARFQPSATVGIGDDRTIWMFNIDGAYHIPVDGNWNPYAGAGLGIGVESNDATDDTEVTAGLNLLGGVEWGSRYRYFFEARTQIGTSLGDFTVVFGMNF
jgi:hypothetical protein